MHRNHFQSVLFIRKTRNSFSYYWKSSGEFYWLKEIFQIIVDFWGSTLAGDDRFGEFTRSKLYMKEYIVLYGGISDEILLKFGQFFSNDISIYHCILSTFFRVLEGNVKTAPQWTFAAAGLDWPGMQEIVFRPLASDDDSTIFHPWPSSMWNVRGQGVGWV